MLVDKEELVLRVCNLLLKAIEYFWSDLQSRRGVGGILGLGSQVVKRFVVEVVWIVVTVEVGIVFHLVAPHVG